MSTEEYIDGNAAAGTLAQIFSAEVTTARVTCAHCEREGLFGQLRLYGNGPGQVLRCAACGGVNMRFVERADQLVLDLKGAERLVFKLPGPNSA